MDYVFITLIIDSESFDLKVPGFTPVTELLNLLSEALSISLNKDSRVQAEPLGRILENDKTIVQQGVTQGSILTVI